MRRLLRQILTLYVFADIAGSSSGRCSFLEGQILTHSPICSLSVSWNC